MGNVNKNQQRILIVDDSEMNRDILSEMLNSEYQIIEATDGTEAIAILQQQSVNIDLVLLDIVMPMMDGYEVLAIMNSKHWIDDIPVIMISSENSLSYIERAYELGVTDFINRPFDALIVRRRVVNTIMLYAKQKKLVRMVADQIYEKEKNNSLMINILSHIVEFKNGESGLHILHVKTFTNILSKRLSQITDKYSLSNSDITLISNAAALHDIGKISIPDEILNKPGRLTNEEFAIMKTHSSIGASMLDGLQSYRDEPLVKKAYEICRWHHERYDGRGYPDGLKGDEIPISAQIVALADVYDALTSERVYKKAFSHETALTMILNGECGAFNPLLLQCLKDVAEDIKNELEQNSISQTDETDENEMKNIVDELIRYDELSSSERTLHLLEYEHIKNNFFASISDEIRFEYTVTPSMLTLTAYGAKRLGLKEVTMNPNVDNSIFTVIDKKDFNKLSRKIRNTTPNQPIVHHDCIINYNGTLCNTRIICRTIWIGNNSSHYMGVIGKIVDINDNN